MSSLTEPDKLGKAAALVLLTILYALMADLLLVTPFAAAVQKRLAERGQERD